MCAIRRSIRLTVAQYLKQLVSVIGLAAFGLGARYLFTKRRKLEARAEYLATLALDRLAVHKALSMQNASQSIESWISMSQLRDDLLRNDFSVTRRQSLWKKVQQIVEENSNIRSMVREGESGEISRVWEWIGAISASNESSKLSSASKDNSYGGGANKIQRENSHKKMPLQDLNEVRPLF